MSCAGHERHRTGRKAGLGQRRLKCMLDDGLRCAKCVGANPEHDGVSGPQNAGGIGENVWSSLENEPNNP